MYNVTIYIVTKRQVSISMSSYLIQIHVTRKDKSYNRITTYLYINTFSICYTHLPNKFDLKCINRLHTELQLHIIGIHTI